MYLAFLSQKKKKAQKVASLSFALLLFPILAFAAILSIGPASDTVAAGDLVKARIIVSSDVALNAVSGHIAFPTNLFTIESVSKAGSILNFWVTEPSFSNSTGVVNFEGVALGGFQGGTGTVLTVTLRALKPGSGSAAFQSGQILANDGQGTDITSGLSGATFSVEAAKEKPKTEEVKAKPAPEAPAKEEPQIPATLTAPEISLGSKYGAPAIVGTSQYPNAQVLLTFVSAEGSKIFITGESDESGGFVMLVPNALKRGAYTVTAQMIKTDGTHSDVSKEIVINVGSILSDIGWGLGSAIIFLLLALFYLFVRSFFHFHKSKHTKSAIRHEVREAENVLHKSFDILREDVDDHAASRALNKDLDAAEKTIDKEIKDIEEDVEI
jgi:hypothetical protein